jgi:hypothetical protein
VQHVLPLTQSRRNAGHDAYASPKEIVAPSPADTEIFHAFSPALAERIEPLCYKDALQCARPRSEIRHFERLD